VATFDASFVIPRPLAATFAFVTDFRNAPSWDSRTYEAYKTTGGPIGLGTRFLLRGGLMSTKQRLQVPEWLRQTSELEYEVVSFIPPREMVVRGETAALRYEDHLVFSAEGDTTRLRYLATLELKGVLGAVADPVLEPIFDAIGGDATRGIPAAVEAALPVVRPACGPGATSPALPASPIVGPDDVRRVVALDDQPVLRNLFITQGYHDVSEAIRARTGGADINWCTLGTWASKTAGAFIRDEEVPAVFRRLLEAPGPFQVAFDGLQRALSLGTGANLFEVARAILHDCSMYITAGNKIVYAELAQCCADFVHALGHDTTPQPAKLAAFQASYSDGPPEPDAVEWGPRRMLLGQARGGQVMLRGMVAQLYRAMFEPDPRKRAQAVLHANALGGLHEQTRLQTYIAGGIDAPLANTLLAWAHKHVDRNAPAVERGLLHTTVDTIMPTLGRTIEDAWRHFSTDLLMTLTLPDGVLHLGQPLPQDAGAPVFPPALATIDDPELAAVLDRFGALDVQVGHSAFDWLKDRVRSLFEAKPRPAVARADVGALDWTRLEQRMRFILTLFRVRQQDAHLFAPPFTDEQRAAMFAGRIPQGAF